jgi:hypothetical protein
MDASQLWYPEIVQFGRNTSFASFYVLKVRKSSETLANIILGPMDQNGCFTTLVSRNIAFGPETRVFLLLLAEGLRNAPKHFQTSFWVEWTGMDATQLWYPEIVHSSPKYEFCTFYVPKVSEMLRNIRKHHFGSNGPEWMLHNFGIPKYCIRARNISFSSFYLPRVCEMLRDTSKHHSGSNGLELMLHNFGTTK